MLKSLPRVALRHSSYPLHHHHHQTVISSINTINRKALKKYSNMAKLNITIPALKLDGGASIPMLGYGVGTAWGKKDEDKTDQAIVDAVKMAIGLGYYHLDGAESYKNEKELGQGIKESGVDRSKLFVTTKVGNSCVQKRGGLFDTSGVNFPLEVTQPYTYPYHRTHTDISIAV